MNSRFLYLCAIVPLCLSFFSASAADIPADRIPFTLADDFEKGELDSWESYPIAEDPGFDPQIWCVREPAHRGSAYSLSRVLEPNDTDYPADENLVGMTRKFRIWLRADSEVRLSAFMDGDRRAAELRVVLYAADGKRYRWSLSNPPANEWVEIARKASDFRADGGAAPSPGTVVEAAAVCARYGPVNPHRSYSLCLDDFALSGERPRRFIPVNPGGEFLDKFHMTVLTHHIAPGGVLSLAVRPEEGARPIRLVSVACTVVNPSGAIRAKGIMLADDGSAGDEKPGDGVWSAGAVYRITDSDPAGFWTAIVEGTGEGGERVRDTLRFVVPVKRFGPGDHPRLFFTRGESDSLRRLLAADPKRKKIFDDAVRAAKSAVDRGNIADIVEAKGGNREFLDGGPFSTTWDYYTEWSRPGGIVRNVVTAGAFLYALDGDRAAGLKAKEFMLRFAEFREWQHPWFLARNMYSYYQVGLWTYAMGIGYDLLYPLFTPEERTKIRNAVMEKAVIPHYRDHVVLNRKPSNITNHIGMNTSGILLAALAFLGEDPENPDMEPYLSGILAKYKAHIDAAYRPDGSYAEPEGYAGTDAEDLVKCLCALERMLGVDWTTTTHVRDAYLYPLYLATETGKGCPAFGDGGRDWGFAMRNLHLWLAHRTKDPSALERYRWETESGAFDPAYSFFDYLWAPDAAIVQAPRSARPPSICFPAKGNVVFRSGWESDALIFSMKCGPHSNHYHLDQGTFWLLYNGETLISEAGYATYYRNLYYRQYYIQPIAHNTLLLNRYPESQRLADLDDDVRARNEFPRITSSFTSAFVDEVEGEMSCVYKGRLDRFSRSFVYLRPDYLVLFDDVAARAPEEFTRVFHAEGKNIFKGGERTVRIVRPNAELRMEILAPERFDRRVNSAPDRDESFMFLDTPAPSTKSQFLAVLVPMRVDNREARDAWKIARLDGGGWTGAEIARESGVDVVWFRTGAGGNPPGFVTDGDRLAAAFTQGGSLGRIWVRGATTCSRNGEAVFSSSVMATAAIDFAKGGATVEAECAAAGMFAIRTVTKPREVVVNGKPVKFVYEPESKTTRFPAPMGRSKAAIR